MARRIAHFVPLALVILLVATACGSGDGGSASPSATATEATTPTETGGAGAETTTEAEQEEPSEDPGAFFERQIRYQALGQFGRAWDDLHPGHQKVVTRSRFDDCKSEAFATVNVTVDSFKVIEVYDDPIDVAGVPEKTSKAVTAEITVSAGEETETSTDTFHAVGVGDRWVWLLPPSAYRAYKAGRCPD